MRNVDKGDVVLEHKRVHIRPHIPLKKTLPDADSQETDLDDEHSQVSNGDTGKSRAITDKPHF